MKTETQEVAEMRARIAQAQAEREQADAAASETIAAVRAMAISPVQHAAFDGTVASIDVMLASSRGAILEPVRCALSDHVEAGETLEAFKDTARKLQRLADFASSIQMRSATNAKPPEGWNCGDPNCRACASVN